MAVLKRRDVIACQRKVFERVRQKGMILNKSNVSKGANVLSINVILSLLVTIKRHHTCRTFFFYIKGVLDVQMEILKQMGNRFVFA